MNVKKIADFINHSKTTQKVLERVSKNPAVFSTLAACGIAGIIRPLSIIPIPMKDPQDKKYSIASSISAGLTELITAPLIYMPFQKALNKSGDLLYDTKNSIYMSNPTMIKQYKSITNRCFKMAVLPFIAMLRFATVSPVVKALYGKKKETKKGLDVRA